MIVKRLSLLLVGLFVVEMLVLLIPPLINGGPILFPDLLGYWRGGQAAIAKVISILHHNPQADNAVGTSFENAHVVRSAFYSLYTYLTASVSLWLLIAIQAAIVIAVLHQVYALISPKQPGWRASLFVILVGLTTTLAWATSSAMPDVFTALMALAMITLIIYWQNIKPVTRLWLIALVFAGVVVHVSNLPVALGVLIAAAVIRIRRLGREWSRLVLLGGTLAVGAFAMIAISVVVFKEWTLSPHAPTFMLARSIEDGPGKLYLKRHCPEIGLAMCNHLDKLYVGTENFIWSDDPAVGVYSVAPPEEQAQLRREDKRIWLAAAREYPWMQIKATVSNTVAQVFYFTYLDYYIPSHAEFVDGNVTVNPSTLQLVEKPWQVALDIPTYAVVFLGLLACLLSWWRGRLTRDERDFFLLIIATVVANAMVSTLSTLSARYEARVIWLIPMTGLLFLMRDREIFGMRPRS